MAGTRSDNGGIGLWPGVLAPLGLTLILGACLWLFVVKVDTDREEAEAERLRLESYALVEVREIAAVARASASEFVNTRRQARRATERNLALEVKGVLDSVYNLLTLGLDKASRKTAPRREVGDFPPGFDGMRRFLELAPSEDADPALSTLRANSPEIVSVLPSDCYLAVIEDNARVLYSHGGGARPAGSLSVSLSRDFIFNDGGKNRNWSLRVELSAPDANPEPGAGETAERVGRDLAGRTLHDADWQGWLLDDKGQAAATFSASAAKSPNAPPLINMPAQWLELEGRRRVWLELAAPADGLGWRPAVSVAVTLPPEAPGLWGAAMSDKRWSLTLAALILLNLAGWIWFIRAMFAPPAARPKAEPAPEPAARRRLVRDPGKERVIPDVEGVIVADISANGDVNLAAGPAAARPSRPAVMPSGSLGRLQTIHRGREGLSGSRILDQAKSPILRELAARVRPSAKTPPAAAAAPRRAAAEQLAATAAAKAGNMGWRKGGDGV